MEIILLLVFARICGVQDLIGLVNKILAPLGNKLQQIAQSKNKSEVNKTHLGVQMGYKLKSKKSIPSKPVLSSPSVEAVLSTILLFKDI